MIWVWWMPVLARHMVALGAFQQTPMTAPLLDARGLAEGVLTVVAVVSWYSFRKLQGLAEQMAGVREVIGGAAGLQQGFVRFEDRVSSQLNDINSLVTSQRVEIANLDASLQVAHDSISQVEAHCAERHEVLLQRIAHQGPAKPEPRRTKGKP